jgi:acyl-CoA synthetase (AMP-forming)/AMP-acid ligase II
LLITYSGHLIADCPRHQVINRAGEKISPLAVEHALLAACIGPEAPDEPPTAALGTAPTPALDMAPTTAPGTAPGTARRPAGELYGWVREVLAFAAPHEELGEAVGVAVVCESGRTVTLAQVCSAFNGLMVPDLMIRLMIPLMTSLMTSLMTPLIRSGAPRARTACSRVGGCPRCS